MATLSRIVPGQVLYVTRRQRQGNTTLTRSVVFTEKVVEVNAAEGWVLSSWNSNRPRKCYEHEVKKWRLTPPKVS